MNVSLNNHYLPLVVCSYVFYAKTVVVGVGKSELLIIGEVTSVF